ncbi:zinc metallopeptidase [Alkalibacillus haloalkaliphilus]|uniref:zinc metallopeptidase n=1 Tax=Alkalibacillus haloalkaliphilus TaxID=94136 RepID=UPI0029361798|nr:zinc metallopeptidase [Alkalibacillus haloalkaliphilus]MDV2580815.1 zinc metallopeptidase [Alkalibacillus haloalkaliphilus]
MSIGAFLIYFAILLILPLWAQSKVKNTYKKHMKIAVSSGMTGREVAQKLLQENGLYDVRIEETKGFLSDHYDPSKKVVRLSSHNYHEPSQSAAAVAAHEVGHAIQDAEGYAFLRFRHALVPIASFGSNASFFFIIAGILFGAMQMFLVGIIFMAFAVLFQLVTLPVEFDASNRAMGQMVGSGIIGSAEHRETKKVLDAAAWTYVAGAVVALMELIRFILMFLHMND